MSWPLFYVITIIYGNWQAGDCLPSLREGANNTTARTVTVIILEEEGFAATRTSPTDGRGSYYLVLHGHNWINYLLLRGNN